jgi:hypothetical protein
MLTIVELIISSTEYLVHLPSFNEYRIRKYEFTSLYLPSRIFGRGNYQFDNCQHLIAATVQPPPFCTILCWLSSKYICVKNFVIRDFCSSNQIRRCEVTTFVNMEAPCSLEIYNSYLLSSDLRLLITPLLSSVL